MSGSRKQSLLALTAFALFFGTDARAQKSVCSALLDGVAAKMSSHREFDELLSKLQGNGGISSLYAGVKNTPSFKRFREDKKIKFITRLNAVPLLKSYLNWATGNYTPDRLPSLRAQSLRRNLMRRGVELLHDDDPWGALARISKSNLTRLKGDDQIRMSPAMHRAVEVASKITVSLVHNTHLNNKPQNSILSSKELQRLGLGGGMNSKDPFNTEFLQTDDQVFFRANIRSSKVDTAFQSAYGESQIILDPEYARRFAWISYYVMEPFHLKHFASDALGLKISEVRDAWTWDPNWEYARQNLYKLDFTISDFESLIRHQLLQNLQILLTQNPAEFEEALQALGGAHETLFKSWIGKLVPLSRMSFEGKVPVAVDPSAINFISATAPGVSQ